MARIRRRFSAEFKCKVALAAIRSELTVDRCLACMGIWFDANEQK